MREEARITFYSIDRCGYYQNVKGEVEFGDIKTTLVELNEWAFTNSIKLGETCTYVVEESEEGYHTYCFDLAANESTGDYLLTTWNETPSVNGNVASVSGSSSVGEVEVDLNQIPPGNIPGYATYFWFVPSKQIFATVQFQHRVNGHQNLVKYLKEFLAKYTKYVVSDRTDEGVSKIKGYRESTNDQTMSLSSQFATSLLKNPGDIAYIKSNYQYIRKIIRKNTLSIQTAEELSFIQRFFVNLGISDPQLDQEEIRQKFEVNYSPSLEEVNTMIEYWESNHETQWDDLGFLLKNKQTPVWLSHSLARNKFELDVARQNQEIVNGNSLLNALTQQREIILRLIEW